MTPVLSLHNVSKHFGGVQALQDVDFQVLPGEVHCLAGENGSGKSTLIKLITGVYRPEPGSRMEIHGEPVPAMTPALARRAGIQVIWQDLALFPEMTVAENIAFEAVLGAGPRWVRHGRLRRLASETLARLGVSLDVDAPLREFPIAQRQIVAIARALTVAARVVFMDEPTASLTHTETERLLAIVRKLSGDGIAVVFVSHRLAEVLAIAQRVTVLRDGRLVGVYPAVSMSQSRLTELMTGQTFEQRVNACDRGGAPVVLRVAGLSRRGDYDNVSFTIRQGETVGLTGLLGAGRTELALALFGMRAPDSGSIALDGQPLALDSNRDAIRAGIAYLSEDRLSLGLVQEQPIADNLVLPVLDRVLVGGFIAGSRKTRLVDHWLRELAIKIGLPGDPVSTLSGGNQQRVAIAKWLATEPRVLILDGPTVGVDVGARAGIFEIVARLAREGLAILLISDEVPEVYHHSDRVLHMADGRIRAEYDPRQCELVELERAVYG